MDSNERAIKILDELARSPREAGPVTLALEYIKAIEYIESLPANQSGCDKSWVWNAQASFQRHYRNARPR